MARRIRVREILRLKASGLSGTAIAGTRGMSKASAMDAFHAADDGGVAWEDVEGMGDAGAHALLFPERPHGGPALTRSVDGSDLR